MDPGREIGREEEKIVGVLPTLLSKRSIPIGRRDTDGASDLSHPGGTMPLDARP